MTHLLDSSAVIAHFFGEPGADRVQDLLADNQLQTGTSILVLFEFEVRLKESGLDQKQREDIIEKYRALFCEIVDVDEGARREAMNLRVASSTRLSAMDALIAGAAASRRGNFGSSRSALPKHSTKSSEPGDSPTEIG
jgi:predicted nucleic acid-binding protein